MNVKLSGNIQSLCTGYRLPVGSVIEMEAADIRWLVTHFVKDGDQSEAAKALLQLEARFPENRRGV